MAIRALLIMLLLSSLVGNGVRAEETLNACVRDDGRVYFSNRPCNDARQQRRVILAPISETNPVPADPLRGWVAAYRELQRRLSTLFTDN